MDEPQVQPSDWAQGLQWLLDHVSIASSRSQLQAYIYLSPPEAAKAVSEIIGAATGISSRLRKESKSSSSVVLGLDFIRWMEEVSPMPECPTSSYHRSLKYAQQRTGMFLRRVELERARLIALLELKHGRKGCFHCGKPATECQLEFDHIDPSLKTERVSRLLMDGKWPKAEAEALKCRLLCRPCHRLKTISNGEHTGRPRLPPSTDPDVQKYREYCQSRNKKRGDQGRERLAKAKLDAKCCTMCGRSVDSTNLYSFDFDHTDIGSKKTPMSRLHTASDATFYAELKGCRLLCTYPCHAQATKLQNTEIRQKSLATRKRNRATSDEPVAEAQKTSEAAPVPMEGITPSSSSGVLV